MAEERKVGVQKHIGTQVPLSSGNSEPLASNQSSNEAANGNPRPVTNPLKPEYIQKDNHPKGERR